MASHNYSYCIIAGSTKCATTSVFAWLADHPMVCGSVVKESRFFWDNTYPMPSTGYHYSNGISSFQSIFKCEKNETILLEATPDYMYGDTTASIINSAISGVKIIFVLRHPVDRLVSWYKFAAQRNLFDSQTTFEQYVNMQVMQPDAITPQHLRAMEQGRYAFYLKKYAHTL
ncbi:MAG: sulfotransferase domain-containing protein [Bacteroidetes bacterium]|nr:sulfotransferase domain-containing protein [Bacteroidota bacterium]